MEIPFLDLKRFDRNLKKSLQDKFEEMLDCGVFSGGKEVFDLEYQIKNKLGSIGAIPCANGTDAIELSLRAIGIGIGDEVIVPALTWVSTAEAVVMVGAKPVFWDTDQDGLLANDWDLAVTSKTKAVIPVHLYGKMPDMEMLTAKATLKSIFVIEDAAQAFGAFQKGKSAGIWGEIGCLSFYPTKNLGALGEAGMCLTQNPDLEQRIKLLLNHGQPKRDQHILIGRNSRIDTIQAGFLNVFLNRFEEFQQRRKVFAKRYTEAFVNFKKIRLPNGIFETDHNAHLFVIQLEQRDELKSFLSEKGVGTAVHYPSVLPDMGLFDFKGDFPNARKIANQGLSLPLNPFLLAQEQEYIIEQIRSFFNK